MKGLVYKKKIIIPLNSPYWSPKAILPDSMEWYMEYIFWCCSSCHRIAGLNSG